MHVAVQNKLYGNAGFAYRTDWTTDSLSCTYYWFDTLYNMEVDDVHGSRKVSCLDLNFETLGYPYYALNIYNFGSPKNSELKVLFHIFRKQRIFLIEYDECVFMMYN